VETWKKKKASNLGGGPKRQGKRGDGKDEKGRKIQITSGAILTLWEGLCALGVAFDLES